MLEFVCEPYEDNSYPEVVQQALVIAQMAFRECGITDLSQRTFDQCEAASLRAATNARGNVDMRTYIAAQSVQRLECDVPSSNRTLSVLYGPAFVQETEGTPVDAFGYSIRELHEAVCSTHNIRRLLLKSKRFNDYAAHFFAYTMAHEAGHLHDLVDENVARSLTGRHCANICVMRSTSVRETAEYLEKTGGSVHFCGECAEDINTATVTD